MPELSTIFFRFLSAAVSLAVIYHYANKYLFGMVRDHMLGAQQHIQAIKEYCQGLATEQTVIANNIKQDRQEAQALEQKLVTWAQEHQRKQLQQKLLAESLAQERDRMIERQQKKMMQDHEIRTVVMPVVDDARQLLQARFADPVAGQQFLEDLAHDLKKKVRNNE